MSIQGTEAATASAEALSAEETAALASYKETSSQWDRDARDEGAPPAADPAAGADPSPKAKNGADGGQDGQESDAGEDGDEEVIITDKNGKPRGRDGKFVSHKALHAEREEHKKTKAELAKTREQFVAGNARLTQLMELANVGETTAKPQGNGKPPAPEDDVFAFVKHLETQLAAANAKIETIEKTRQSKETHSAVIDTYRADAKSFMQTEPALADGYRYLVDMRDKQLEAQGVDDARERKKIIAGEELEIVRSAIEANKRPAEVLFNYAIASGFKKSNAANGKDEADRLATVKRGMAASATLSKSGSGGDPPLTFEALANMDESQLAAVVKKIGKSGLRQLMGE